MRRTHRLDGLSVADVQRSQYKASWHETTNIELDGPKTTGTYEDVTTPRGRKPVGAKWVFTYKTDKDGLIVKTKARLVAKGFSQVQEPGARCRLLPNIRTNSLVSVS